MVSVIRVAQRSVQVQFVVVATTHPLTGQVAALTQVRDEAMSGPLSDPHARGDITQTDIGVAGYATKNSGVVGEEGPIAHDNTITHS